MHNNVTLTQTQKLSYLRQCITSQSVKELLLPESRDPGVYDELVKMLKRRYDKPRKLHQMYCKTLAELPVCRNNADELLAGGDRLHKVVAGLVSLGQIDVYSIATSLGVATLPPLLQSEWETLTKDQKGVPHVDQLVSFMRERSDAVCTLDKKGEPASISKVKKGVGLAHLQPTSPRCQYMWLMQLHRWNSHFLQEVGRQRVKGLRSSGVKGLQQDPKELCLHSQHPLPKEPQPTRSHLVLCVGAIILFTSAQIF